MKKILFFFMSLPMLASAGTVTFSGSPLASITISTGIPVVGAGGTYTYNQETSCNANTFTNTCAFGGGNITAHSLLIVGCVLGAPSGTMVVSDNKGNTYFPVQGSTQAVTSQVEGMFYTLNAIAGATSVTCLDSASGATYDQVSEVEYFTPSGGTYDTGSGTTGSSSAITCGTANTSVSNEFVAAFSLANSAATGQSGTLRLNYVNNAYVMEQDTTVGSPSSYGSTFTQTSGNFACQQAMFK
jgi:hypothetical protein